MQKHRGSLVWLIAWLSLGSAVWLASPRSAQNHAKANATSLSAISDKKPSQEDRLSSSGKRLKSIERVEVGQRVATGISQEIRDLAIGDPLAVPQWDRLDHEIDSQTWRKLTLVMYTPQGDRFEITLLRPIGWLESCNAQVGSSIHLVVSEQGLDGLADVLAIEPCPSISSGVGRVVTGTFTHVRGGILRIRLAGLAEPLGVTSNHSIYSADRLDFVPAGELRVGETLRNLDGDVRIESIEQLGTEERVYNLEIHGEHVFRVASSGVLVHNSSGAEGRGKPVSGFEPHGVNPLPGTRVRPEGIPDGWRIRPTQGKGGVEYYNPKNPNENVRVMQGNPNSPFPNSQGPYVRQRDASGTYLRQDGTPSPWPKGGLKDPDAHIPLQNYPGYLNGSN
jgi:hypothetical protein